MRLAPVAAILVPGLVAVLSLNGLRSGTLAPALAVAVQFGASLLGIFAVMGVCLAVHMGYARDDRRREREWREREGRYRQVEAIGGLGHWLLPRGSGTMLWSPGMYRLAGLPETVVPGLDPFLALVDPDDRAAAHQVVVSAIAEGTGWETQYRIRRPDGEVRHIRSSGIALRGESGEPTATMGVLVDVTELELSRQAAEAASQSKAAFLANMSHEIRTPLNGVLGFTELLIDSDLTDEQRRHLLLVHEAAGALLKLLNDILDISKIEAGEFDISPAPTDVRRILNQCLKLIGPSAEQKRLRLTSEVAADLPAFVEVDDARLRQILFNLLGNAVKFTEAGTVSVTVSRGPAMDGAEGMRIVVEDTGIGIAADRQKAVFDPFVQANSSTSRRYGGTGLGLNICRQLARLMGGTIALESREGEGTSVTVSLPLVAADLPPRLDERRVPRDGAATDGLIPRRSASILLVEDIDINQELVAEMLNRLGHEVTVACNGAEALIRARLLLSDPDAYDMIFMDVQMPVMDGLEATRAIRAFGGRAATIPIVALTANAYAAEVQECRDAGMNDQLSKPCGFVELKHQVERWSGTGAASEAPANDNPAAPGAPLARRFEARRMGSAKRLRGLMSELRKADADDSRRLLREAESIAHMFAGTAGMFGQARLGRLARSVEEEIRALSLEHPVDPDKAHLHELIAALGAPADQPQARRQSSA